MSTARDKKFQPIVDSAWEETRKPLWWHYRISPPFPSVWFPNPNYYSLYYYAYAVDSMMVRDGDMIGSIFGRIEVCNGDNSLPKFERLSDEVREIGIQGVRPLEQTEINIYRQEDLIEAYLMGLTGAPDEMSNEAQLTKQFYRLWFEHSGIAAEIRPYHDEFFKWVEYSEEEFFKGVEKSERRWWKFW